MVEVKFTAWANSALQTWVGVPLFIGHSGVQPVSLEFLFRQNVSNRTCFLSSRRMVQIKLWPTSCHLSQKINLSLGSLVFGSIWAGLTAPLSLNDIHEQEHLFLADETDQLEKASWLGADCLSFIWYSDYSSSRLVPIPSDSQSVTFDEKYLVFTIGPPIRHPCVKRTDSYGIFTPL